MSLSFASVTLAKDGPGTIETAIEMGLAAKLFKMMGHRSLDDLNGKTVVAVKSPHWTTHRDVTSLGTEFLTNKPPREVQLVCIMDRGGQLRLDGSNNNLPSTIYITHHHDGRIEALTQQGHGDALPGPLPPTNPAENLAEGSLPRRLMEWYQSGDTGVSSETMRFAAFGGKEPRSTGFPHDPSDLGRCIRFLEKFPEARDKLDGLRSMNSEPTELCSGRGLHSYTDDDVWGVLLDHWDELVALYQEELPQERAPKCYARMKELIQSVQTPVKQAAPRG